MARFDPRQQGSLPHAGTFNNNVLTMAAGIAALSEVYTPEAAKTLNAAGENLRNRLNEVAKRHGVKMCFTGIGSMLNVHMLPMPPHSPVEAAKGNMQARDLFFFDLQKAGIWLARRGMMSLSVPLTAADYNALVAAVEEFASTRGHLLH